jgi:beta-lactam-binding protein with PASTA domain
MIHESSASGTSCTPDDIRVPRLIGLGFVEARDILARAGLALGTLSFDQCDEYPAGVVLRQDLPGGFFATQGARINLVVNLI